MSSVEKTFLTYQSSDYIEKRSYMVVSDLCGSTSMLMENYKIAVGLQAAHEQLCSDVAKIPIQDPRFKSMGDGVWMQVDDAAMACRIALTVSGKACECRKSAETGRGNSHFKEFHLKLVVASGDFRPAPGSQKWLGELPTKAARIASYAHPDEVWVDNGVLDAVRAHLDVLAAEIDEDPGNGAAFYVPLKGFGSARISIHEVRHTGILSRFSKDERAKEWLLPWTDVMVGLRSIIRKIEESRFRPVRVVGIGRSGAILGGIIAGNLEPEGGEGHVPVDVVERRHLTKTDPRRIISTLTEPEETYLDDQLESDSQDSRPAWNTGPVLLVIGEAKTSSSFRSVRCWLERRRISHVMTAALVKGKLADADFYWLEAANAWLPWQFKPGYDQKWPTYERR